MKSFTLFMKLVAAGAILGLLGGGLCSLFLKMMGGYSHAQQEVPLWGFTICFSIMGVAQAILRIRWVRKQERLAQQAAKRD